MARYIPMQDGSTVRIEDDDLPVDQYHPEADKFARDKVFVTDEQLAREGYDAEEGRKLLGF